MIFLQRVRVSEICFLQEVLFWVAFRRLPVAINGIEGTEIRNESREIDYAVDIPDIVHWLYDEECASANIPPDPRYAAAINGNPLSIEDCDDYIEEIASSDSRPSYIHDLDELVAFKKNMELWLPQYESAIEYPASRIFVALKAGRIKAKGRLLPEKDLDSALALFSDEDFSIEDHLPVVEIPATFWSLKGIDFDDSAAASDFSRYCHIHCLTDEVFSVFPGDRWEPVFGVEKFGPTFLINDAAATRQIENIKQRGRPSYSWDAFHLEVATFIQKGQLPAKKEACIQHLQDWFHNTFGVRPSRAAIGERLKPYYDRFARMPDRK
jgi:hypothetical protein